MKIIPWKSVGSLNFGARSSEVEAAIGTPIETLQGEGWTICDYGYQEIAWASYCDGRLSSMLVVPVEGTTLWNRSLKSTSQTDIENLLLANGHEYIRRPRVHALVRDAITAPLAGLDFSFTDDCCDAVGVQAATLTNVRHLRSHCQHAKASEEIISNLDDMLVAMENA
jgi:hypothetical protein